MLKTEDRRKRSPACRSLTKKVLKRAASIYDGSKNARGHSAGMSLTFDKYDGDQVMQLLTVDEKRGDRRVIRSGLAFNDRPEFETQDKTREIMRELTQIADRAERHKKIAEYLYCLYSS
ncbi:hypothetical protein ALON55S_08784 [Alishewanella longhuensis]